MISKEETSMHQINIITMVESLFKQVSITMK